MLGLSRRDRRIMSNQPHLDGDLPRRGIGIRAHQEEPATFGQPLVVDALQHQHRIIQMFQHMGQHDVVIALGQGRFLEERIDEIDLVTQLLSGFVDSDIRGLDTGNVIEIGQESSGEVALETPSSSRLPFLKNGSNDLIM